LKKPKVARNRIARHFGIDTVAICIAVAAVLVLFIRALDHFDDTWDGTAYHLVFAAFRAGILSPDDLTTVPLFRATYQSFPPLLDVLHGYAWRITDSVLFLQTFPVLAILCLAWFWLRRFDLAMGWSIIAILTVPLIQTSATALYIDTFCNCVFAIPVSIVSMSFIDRRPLSNTDLTVSLIALATVANCKPQFPIW